MTDDELARAAATALKARFPDPADVDLTAGLNTPAGGHRRTTVLAAAACVLAVAGIGVGVAVSSGGRTQPMAARSPQPTHSMNGPMTPPVGCSPGAADVTVRLGGAHLLGNRIPVKVGVTPGDDVRVVAGFGSRHLTSPATRSGALHTICTTGSHRTVSTYFRAVRPGSATVTSRTSDCARCMQVEFTAHIAVVAKDNNNGCCPPSSSEAALLKLGFSAARAQGAVAETITAVRSTHAHAVWVTMQARVSGEQPVWVVQVKTTHEFTCRACTGPPGSSVRGRYILQILDAKSLKGTDGGIEPAPAPLARLGHVITVYSR